MKTLSLGTKDVMVLQLKKELFEAGFNQFLGEERKKGFEILFNDNLLKTLILYQKANNYDESIYYEPVKDDVAFIEAGPVFTYFDKKYRNRQLGTTNGDFYKIIAKEDSNGKKYRFIFKNKKAWVPEEQVYKRKPYCGVLTWSKLREKTNCEPNRTETFEKTTGVKVKQVVANIDSAFSESINVLDNLTGTAKGLVQDVYSAANMITTITTNLIMDNVDFNQQGKVVSIANLTDKNNNYIVYLPIVPESVNVSHSVSWENQVPMGRTSGYAGYSNTTDRSVSFGVDLYIRDFDDKDTYQKAVNYLLALTYPLYENGKVIPPRCYVSIYGQLKFCGYCTGNNPTYKGDIVDGVYSHTSFSLSFVSTSNVPFDMNDVKEKGELSGGEGASSHEVIAPNMYSLVGEVDENNDTIKYNLWNAMEGN